MNLGAAAFWIFLAAIIIAGIWRKKHSEQMRHETVRLLIEKNQKPDDAQLAELLNPKPEHYEWPIPKEKPGEVYRVMRIIGTILIFISVGTALMGLWRGMILGIQDRSVLFIMMLVPVLAMLGIALFVASRFVTKPPSDWNREKRAQ